MEVKLNNVSYAYNIGTKLECPVFRQINATFKVNKVTIVMGKSGSGKTTLLELLAGFIKPNEGEIVKSANNLLKVGMFFKNPDEQFLKATVKQELELSTVNIEKNKKDSKISSVLKQVGLDDSYLNRNPLKLSRSEMVKVSLAGMLLYNPKVMLFDEPTIGLSSKSKLELVKIIRNLKNKVVVITSNDVEFIHKLADYIYIIDKGKVFLEGNKYEVFSNSKLNNKFKIPKLVEFKLKAFEQGVNLENRDDIKDLMKDVYRHVAK